MPHFPSDQTTSPASLSGRARPGVTSALFDALHQTDARVLDVEQLVIRGRLVLGVEATSRWIPGLVDAGHLDLIDRPRRRTVAELRQIIAWLLGRARPDR